MRAVVQRVTGASVVVDGRVVGEIGSGLFVLVGVGHGDVEGDAKRLAAKIAGLRIFEDGEGRMNRSVRDVEGRLLVVSEFTLYGDATHGHRPSYSEAMPVEEARTFWPVVEEAFRTTGVSCTFGVFQAMMQCSLTNDGPVTISLSSK